MKFYQVVLIADGGESAGSSWHRTKREANSAAAEWRRNSPAEGPMTHGALITDVTVEFSKAGILKVLKRYASHPDNG